MSYDPYFIFKILDYFHYLLTDPRTNEGLSVIIICVYFMGDHCNETALSKELMHTCIHRQ